MLCEFQVFYLEINVKKIYVPVNIYTMFLAMSLIVDWFTAHSYTGVQVVSMLFCAYLLNCWVIWNAFLGNIDAMGFMIYDINKVLSDLSYYDTIIYVFFSVLFNRAATIHTYSKICCSMVCENHLCSCSLNNHSSTIGSYVLYALSQDDPRNTA